MRHWISFGLTGRANREHRNKLSDLRADSDDYLIQPLRRVIWSLILPKAIARYAWYYSRVSTDRSPHYIRWFLLARYCPARFNAFLHDVVDCSAEFVSRHVTIRRNCYDLCTVSSCVQLPNFATDKRVSAPRYILQVLSVIRAWIIDSDRTICGCSC